MLDPRRAFGRWGARLQLIGGRDVSLEEQWQLLDTLYDVKPLVSAAVAICLASWLVWQHDSHISAGLWPLSSIVILAARTMLARAYFRRSKADRPQRWIDGFFIAATLTGLQWGLGGLMLSPTQDGAASSAIIGIVAALLAGAAVRGYSFPVATITQVNLTALMIAIFSLSSGNYVFVFVMLLYGYYQTKFVRSLAALRLKQIFSEQQRQTLLLSLEQTNIELASANMRLHDIALTDALTAIPNRRSFDLELPLRWTQTCRKGGAISLLMIDVDNFKRFNDTHGHPAGDKCLALVAAALRSVARRPSDHAARYGGEEFALILPDTDIEDACVVADRVVQAVRSIAVPVAENRSVAVTVSVGIGSLTPTDGLDEAILIAVADQALYRAKQDGRDCIRSGTYERPQSLEMDRNSRRSGVCA